MIYVPTQFLQAGMVLAKDAPGNSFFLPLIAAGQALTDTSILKLNHNGVAGVYVVSNLSTAEPRELMEPQKKKQLLTDIKKLYADCNSSNASLSAMYTSVSKMAGDLVDLALSMDEVLVNVVDIRDYDNYTYSHSMYVGMLSTMIAAEMKLPRLALTDIAVAGLLHDVGKIDLPVELVNKPGPLTTEEFNEMKKHPENGRTRLCTNATSVFSLASLLAVASHHEKYDGTGYPLGLVGNAIPLHGRILALADVYDALTSNRPYRRAWEPVDTINYMMGCSDTHFDRKLLQVFMHIISAYPVGTIVTLSNGWIAVVHSNTKGQSLRPMVCIATPQEQRGRIIDLASDRSFLNVTITNTLSSLDHLPEGVV